MSRSRTHHAALALFPLLLVAFGAVGAHAGEAPPPRIAGWPATEQLTPGVRGRIFEQPEPLENLAPKSQFCGAFTDDPPGTRPSFAWQDYFVALTRLGNHFMPGFGDGDSMTSPFWHDQGTATPFGSPGLSETWYISRDQLSGTAPFYRLLAYSNHMDSPHTSEGAYVLDLGLPHGYPWTTQKPGTNPLRRYYNSSISDHRTWLYSQTPSGYTTGATWTTATPTPRYGYERFGNQLDMCSVYAASYGTYQLQNSTFKIEFNKIWGGAIGRITHLPTGKQLASEAIGDMVQSTLFRGTSADPPGSCCLVNPTESGGTDTWNYSNTKRWTGSPILTTSFSGSNPRSFIRELRPLNFTTNGFQGNDAWSPLLWRGTFRKTTTLGATVGATTYGDVIRILFEAKLDGDVPTAAQGVYNMNNVFWLRMNQFGDGETNDFDLELFDVVTNSSTTISYPAGWRQDVLLTGPTNKAMVITDSTGTFAVGMMRQGQADYYKILYWCSSNAPENGQPCPLNNQLFVIDIFKNRTLSTTAYTAEEALMVAGSPTSVKQRLRQLAGY